MFKVLFGVVLSLSFSAQARNAVQGSYVIDPAVHKNSDLGFVSHQGDGRFGTYLTMEVQYQPVKKLFEQIQEKRKVKLKNRGEAHITVVTPLEYFDVLKSHLSMNEIDQLAQKLNIQSALFEMVCLGRGQVKADTKTDETYYIVVNSPKLSQIRQEIQKLFEQKGGAVNTFKAESYYPHITVGFTTRDLHESDGVIKNDQSCVDQITHSPSK